MKKLFLILAIVSGIAQADTWVMPNQGNGEIVITDQVCKQEKALKFAYSWTEKIYFEGCWGIIDNNVHIVWINPDGTRSRRVYRISDFTKKADL